MPGNQRIESVINESSVKKELEWLIDTLEKTHSLIINTPQITAMYKNSEGVKEFKKNTDELIASNQKLLDMQKQLEGATQKIAALEKKLAEDREAASKKKKQMTDEELRASIEESKARSDRQKAMKIEIELMQATENSINKARAANKQLLAERNNLNLATEEGRKKQAELNAEIDKNNDFIKTNVDALSRQKINIGNYEGSAKIIVDALKNVEARLDALKEKQQGLQNLSARDPIGFKLGGQAKELEQVNALLATTQKQFDSLSNITSKPQFINITEGAGNAVQELKFFQKELINLEVNEQGNTEAADKLRQHLATLTDQIGDARAEIKRMSSDSRQFDEFANSVTFLANSFQTGVGAIELFGGASKNTEEAVKTLLAVQALANGVQGIAQQLTERGTAINKAAAYVQGLYTTAMDKSAAASVRLAAATKLVLGGLAIAAVIFFVTKLVEWYKAAGEASEAMKQLGEVTSKAADKYAEAVTQVNKMKTELQLARQGVIDKKKALEEYNTSIGKTIGQAKSLNEAEQKLIDKAPEYIQFTFLKAKAEAAAELAKEALKKSIEEGAKGAEEFLSFGDKAKAQVSTWQGLLNIFTNGTNVDGIIKTNEKLTGIAKKNKDEAVKTEQDKYSAFNKMSEQFYNDAANFAKSHKINFFEDDNKKDTKSNLSDQFKQEDEARKAAFQAHMQQMMDEASAAQRLADDEKASFVVRMAAAQRYFDLKKQMINEQKNFDLTDINKKEAEDIKVAETEKKGQAVINKIRENAAAQRKLIEAKSNSDLLTLNADRYNKERGMFDKHMEDLKKRQEEKQKELIAHKQAMHEVELQNLNNWYEGELLKLDEAYAKKKKHTEKQEKDYNKKKLDLQEEFQIKSLQADLEYTKSILEEAEIRATASGKQEDIDAVISAKSKLASLEIKLQDAITQHAIASNNRQKESDEDLWKKRIERFQRYSDIAKQAMDVVSGFIQNSVDKEKNAIQEREDTQQKNYEAEVDRVNNSTLTVEQKEERLKVLETQRQVQKEQNERKQRQMDMERAKFDKAAAIFEIISKTAVAVMGFLAQQNYGMAIAAGVIGGAELAKAASAPLPKFKDGTENSPEGWALTDEAGPEMYIEPSGKTYMGNNKPTLRYLEKGTKIIPAEEVNKILLQSMMQNTIRMMAPQEEKASKKIDELKELVTWQTFQLKEAYKSSKQPINIFVSDFKNSDYIRRAVRE